MKFELMRTNLLSPTSEPTGDIVIKNDGCENDDCPINNNCDCQPNKTCPDHSNNSCSNKACSIITVRIACQEVSVNSI